MQILFFPYIFVNGFKKVYFILMFDISLCETTEKKNNCEKNKKTRACSSL